MCVRSAALFIFHKTIMRISIAIPYHDTPKTAFFLSRLLDSIDKQSFKDYEIVLTKEGPMAHNHNAAILESKGEIIQMMQMDDYFAQPDSLSNIVLHYTNNPETVWAIVPCFDESNGIRKVHWPEWTDDIYLGNNRLGSISTLSFRRDKGLLFEEPLTWVVDCDLYYRMYLRYGLPYMKGLPDVVVDARTDRLSHTLPDELKLQEVEYLRKKYGK